MDSRRVKTDLLRDAAVQAWYELRPERIVPQRVDLLKRRMPNQTRGLTRIVCRLVGVNPSGPNVIAKRSRRASALVENSVYRDVLPRLPIDAPAYYGMFEEPNGDFCWLFMEDAGGCEYPALHGEHRDLIVQWLALMHTSASHIAPPAVLSDKGPPHYSARLQSTHHAILESLAETAIQAYDISPLETLLRQFDLLTSHWDRCETLCEGTPHTLVHGDFVAKNIRSRTSQAGATIVAFDWGEAGWGTPAVDVMQVDPTTYWSMARGAWPWLAPHTVQRLHIVGTIFRCIDAVYWMLRSLPYEQSKPMDNMAIYASRLARATQDAGLTYAPRHRG